MKPRPPTRQDDPPKRRPTTPAKPTQPASGGHTHTAARHGRGTRPPVPTPPRRPAPCAATLVIITTPLFNQPWFFSNVNGWLPMWRRMVGRIGKRAWAHLPENGHGTPPEAGDAKAQYRSLALRSRGQGKALELVTVGGVSLILPHFSIVVTVSVAGS
jgi:hypothetical protein